MATLETRLRDLATAVGTSVKSTRTLLNGNASDLSGLLTSSKTTVVAALNEVFTLVSGKQQALGFTPENAANKGAANGYASLDGAGKVPSAQLPAYVDDVIEAANLAALPGTGSAGVIYITVDTGKVYRWGGTVYVEISASPGSTDAISEGSVNKYFTDTRAINALATPLGNYDSDYAAVFNSALV